MSGQDRSTESTRPYRMGKRAELVDRTRQRITEAAAHLHATVGPARTTISAIAEEAGVTRLTVYRHFADEEELYRACTNHWFTQHPPPDPGTWRRIGDLSERVEHGLDELYSWYRANADALYLFDRDADDTPATVQQSSRAAAAAAAEALIAGLDRPGESRRLLRAVAGHVVRFTTWRSLAVEQGLDHEQVVGLAVRFVLATANP